jgi:succinate-acetate transporter protein
MVLKERSIAGRADVVPVPATCGIGRWAMRERDRADIGSRADADEFTVREEEVGPVDAQSRTVRRRLVSPEDDGLDEADFADVRPQIFLQPVASPSILGLYALGASAFVFGAHVAGWYGDENSPAFLFPFLAIFGGLAQFLAGMWALRARDGLAVVIFASVGAFWLAYGLLQLVILGEDVAVTGDGLTEFGFWLVPLAVIVWVGTVAASVRSLILTATLGAFALGLSLLALGHIADGAALIAIAGWVLVISSILALYTASALLLDDAMDREVLPLLRTQEIAPMGRGLGEPGVVHGHWMADDVSERRDVVRPPRAQSQWEFQWPLRRRSDE